jgi:GTP cyclohydrolase I
LRILLLISHFEILMPDLRDEFRNMIATVNDIIEVMESVAPRCFAEDWDNVGLQVGHGKWPVEKIWVALDPVPEVVNAACRDNADLLITHHPLIFRPLKCVDLSVWQGLVIRKALESHMAIFAAHTNLDNVKQGINDVLGNMIGLKNLRALRKISGLDCHETGHGTGRTGELDEPVTLADLALNIKKKLRLESVKFAGRANLNVSEVAICSGSGSSLLNDFFSSKASVYISGDLGYHDARSVEVADRGLIDIGHFASEHLMVKVLAQRLEHILSRSEINVNIHECKIEKEPFASC